MSATSLNLIFKIRDICCRNRLIKREETKCIIDTLNNLSLYHIDSIVILLKEYTKLSNLFFVFEMRYTDKLKQELTEQDYMFIEQLLNLPAQIIELCEELNTEQSTKIIEWIRNDINAQKLEEAYIQFTGG